MLAFRRHSFLAKAAATLLLVALADFLFWLQEPGWTIGIFALSLLLITAVLRAEVLLSWPPRIAFAAATFFGLVLTADPGPLALLLFWLSLTLAAFLPRTAGFDDGLRWAARLALHGAIAPLGPLRDLILSHRAKRRRGSAGLLRRSAMLIVPLLGTALFLALFAQANPLIEQALASLDLRLEFSEEAIGRAIFWAFILIAVWCLLRPARFVLPVIAGRLDPGTPLPGIGAASVLISLIAFNALFAVQNGLDLAFLWSGAALPEGMTLAEYAHRGAYPLIATALLAGLFVLVTMRSGSETAASRPIRLLVTLWIAQNLLLVASTMLRTFDYIEAYSLTRLRIAALLWMGLVAVGLALICYRLLRGKSAAWLINANLLAAALVLAASTTVDFGRMAAAWNVRHAREAGGRGTNLDLCYLNQLGPSALLPLIELEARPLAAELRERVTWLRSRTMRRLEESQADWHSWTWRNALRLEAARAYPLTRRPEETRQCDGRPLPPSPKPLTAPAQR